MDNIFLPIEFGQVLRIARMDGKWGTELGQVHRTARASLENGREGYQLVRRHSVVTVYAVD